MSSLGRAVRIVAACAGVLAVLAGGAAIALQTAWFKDELRRRIEREADQYLNGRVSIRRVTGSLWTGIQLEGLDVSLNGRPVLQVAQVGLEYNLLAMVSHGISIDRLTLTNPVLRLERQGEGWNVAALVKAGHTEADRSGPARPFTVDHIGIEDGTLALDEGAGSTPHFPRSLTHVAARLSFRYAPVHYSLRIDDLSWAASDPQIALRSLSGGIALRDDAVYVEGLSLRTEASQMEIDGAVQHYLTAPVFQIRLHGERVSFAELGRIVPRLASVRLAPAVDIALEGPLSRLATTITVQSSAGQLAVSAVGDVVSPVRRVSGTASFHHVDLAPVLNQAAANSDIVGSVRFDVHGPSLADGGSLAATLTIGAAPTRVGGYHIERLQAKAAFERGILTIDGEAAGYGATASVAGRVVVPTDAAGRPASWAYEVRGRVRHADLQRLPLPDGVRRVVTDVNTEYDARGRGAAVDIRARLDTSMVSGALVGAGSRVRAARAGTAVLYEVDVNLERLNLKRVGEDWHIPSLVRPWSDTAVAVQLRGQASARDWTTAVDGAATAVVSDASLFGGRISALTLTGEVQDDALHVVADGAFAGVDPHAAGAPSALAGSLSGRLNVDATVTNLSRGVTLEGVAASTVVNLEPSTIGGVDVASGTLDGSFQHETADIRRFDLTGPALAASAHGAVAFGASGSSDLVLHAESSQLDAIGAALGQPIRGMAALDATVTGTRPRLQIAGTLTGGNLASHGIGALTLATRFAGVVPDFRIADTTLDATTQATFASLGGWQVNELTATTHYAARQLEFDAVARQPGRELAAAGSVDVRADRQQLRLGRLDVRAENHEWQTAPGVVATAQYGGDRVEIHGFTLASGAQRLAVDGALGRDGDALSLTIDGADVAAVEALLLRPPQFAGTLAASATITGTVARPQVAGQFRVDRGAFRGFQYDRFDGSATYDGSGITVDTTLAQNASAHLTARGRLPVALFAAAPGGTASVDTHQAGVPATGQLDLHIDTTPLDLGIVQGLTSQVTKVKGTLEAHVDVTGSAADPHPIGAMTISDGAFVIPATGVSYNNLRGTVDFLADGIHIANVSVLDNQHSALSLSGDLAMHERQVGRVQLYLTAEDFKVIDNKMGNVRVNSSLEVAGDLRAPRVSGEFGVSTGTVNLDPILAALGDSPYPTSPTVDVDVVGPQAAASPSSLVDALQLDVHVTAPDDLVVKASDVRPGAAPIGLGAMNVTVGGDLRATKAPARQVRLLGTVTTVRGFYDFQGRRFDILRDSSARFDGGWQFRPALDIRAERVIQGVTAHVNLRGTLDKPEIVLTSVPPLDPADILALIVFNQPVNQLGEGQQASLVQRAGTLAASTVAGGLGRSIEGALNLSEFAIAPAPDEGGIARVTVGQQVGQNLYLKVQQGIGEGGQTNVVLEYELARWLRLQTNVLQGATSQQPFQRAKGTGADLLFFFSY